MKRISHLLKMGKLSIATALCFFICACSSPSYNTQTFMPETISCNDRSTEVQRRAYDQVYRHNEGDIYWATNEASAIVKPVADSGYPSAVLSFAGMRYERIFLDHVTFFRGKNKMAMFPPSAKLQMVEALSYLYIADELPLSARERESLGIYLRQVNAQGSETPTAWLAEAKANAEAWKTRCVKERAE